MYPYVDSAKRPRRIGPHARRIAYRTERRLKRHVLRERGPGICLMLVAGLVAAALILLILSCGTANAAESANANTNRWTWGDTALEAVFVGVTAIDWDQTRQIANRHSPFIYEDGWARSFIGSHPSIHAVNEYFAISIIAHAGIAYACGFVPEPYGSKLRTVWQSFWIGVETDVTHTNRKTYHLGVSMHF